MSKQKRYLGKAIDDCEGSVEVLTEELERYPLNPRFDLCKHSPDGFLWGYNGSGPAQLAFAILMDHTDNHETSQKYYQDYKDHVIARLPRGQDFTINSRDVAEFLDTRGAN